MSAKNGLSKEWSSQAHLVAGGIHFKIAEDVERGCHDLQWRFW